MLRTPVSCVLALAALGASATTSAEALTPRPVFRIVAAPVTDITQYSATLHVKVTSSGVPVTLTATTVGPDGVSIPSGPLTVTADGDVPLPVSGLQPATRYAWKVTGTRGARTDTANGTFRTPALKPMPQPTISTTRAEYGSRVTLTGTIPGAAGLPVALQQQRHPFTEPFAAVPGAAGATDAEGNYMFTVQALQNTKYGVFALGYRTPNLVNTVPLRVVPALHVRVAHDRGDRVVVSGRYRPDIPARATLYRLGHGRAGSAVVPSSADGNSRTFRFPARKLTPGRYEVRLTTPKHTGIDSTSSTSFTIRRR